PGDDPGRARGRCNAAPRDVEGRGAGKAPGRHQGRLRRRTRRQAEKRSASHLMSVLVIAEHDNRVLKPATLPAVTAAGEIAKAAGGDVHVLVAGKDCRAVAE